MFFCSFLSISLIAEPHYIAFGYLSCGTCHYSMSGGGQINEYGKSFMTPALEFYLSENSDNEDEYEETVFSGFSEDGEPTFQAKVGFDSRFLLHNSLQEQHGKRSNPSLIPMLIEPSLMLARGSLQSYIALSSRKKEKNIEAEKDELVPFSREHWILYRIKNHNIRIGRMVKPFGIRTPDHTRDTRLLVGLEQFDQDYGLEWDYWSRSYSFSLMAFLGNYLVGKPNEQRRGFSSYIEKYFHKKHVLGFSFLSDQSKEESRKAIALTLKSSPVKYLYFLSELDYLLSNNRYYNNSDDLQRVLFTKLGYFYKEWLDLYFHMSRRDLNNIFSYNFRSGLKIRALSFLEFELYFDKRKYQGISGVDYIALQAHAFY